ncbi:MAG: PAS domain S-box protein [Planctomycetota bacterium]|jgi:PAS domain S-box-containing protein|nr:PAS domain S-box protein [Planctomycetota bacterium]
MPHGPANDSNHDPALPSQQDYSRILEAASLVSIIAADAEGLITLFNTGAERILGYRAEEMIGKQTPKIFHLESEVIAHAKTLSAEYGHEISGFETFVFRARQGFHEEREWTYIAKYGEHRTVILTVTAIRNEHNTITGFLAVGTDVTERKQAEQQLRHTTIELRATQRLTQLAMDNIPQFIFWKDADLVYQGGNQNFAEAAGVASPSDLIGKTDFDLAWKREEAEFFRSCDRRVMGSKVAEYHIIEPQLQADGKQAWLDTNKVPLLDDNGQVIGILGTFEDITERKRVEEELRRNEEDLRITLDSIGDAVITTDTTGRVARMNPVAERLTGWPSDEAVGQDLNAVFIIVNAISRQTVESPVTRVLATGQIVGLASGTMLIARDGKEYLIADSGAPIRSAEGDTIGVVLVFRDITEEHRLQEQLRHSQKLDAIGQLAGGVAHDFNNMLGGILGATELLERYLQDHARARKLHGVIMDSTLRAADLTKKLLAFARRQPASSTPIDLHAVLRDVVALLENTVDRRIAITLTCDAESTSVIGDNSQLQSAFLNLGINASHAIPEGGAITISTRNLPLNAAYCEASPFDLIPGRYLEVEVRDTGKGIATEHLPRIFEPFFTTKEQGQGTGLGLSAVYGTVQQHAGAITVYSEPEHGTTFHVMLPLSESTTIREPRMPMLEKGSGRILVVDDEEVMRITAEAILTELGYEVVVANDGADGLATFATNAADFDLVILDMVMPKMNGRDCFAAMRKIKPDARILLSSGFTREQDVDQMRAEGLLGFIRKPYRSADLSQAIRQALNPP